MYHIWLGGGPCQGVDQSELWFEEEAWCHVWANSKEPLAGFQRGRWVRREKEGRKTTLLRAQK
jgi:hypothetical protein